MNGAAATHPEKSPLPAPLATRAAVLIVTAMDAIESTAGTVAKHLGLTVEVAASRAAALRLLERRAYAVVVMDQILAEADPEGTNLVWKNSRLAIPLQMNFALAGGARLERELRAALGRRQREQRLAEQAATATLDAELKNAVTALLLESRLALAERDLSPEIKNRLQRLAGIADHMRQMMARNEPSSTTLVSLRTAEE